MTTFLLLTLSAEPQVTYQQPLLQQVKQAAPDWAALDVDAFSDDTLMAYATRLVREADKVVAVFQVAQPEAPLRACQVVLEEILQMKKPAVIYLQGTHRRLKAIFQARPHFSWQEADTLEALQVQVRQFLHQELDQLK